MRVIFNSEVYDCLKAVKSGKKATLYLTDGGVIVFDGVNDWNVFSIEGGEWEDTDSTVSSYIPTPEQSAVTLMRSMFVTQVADMDDEMTIQCSGLANEWTPGNHTVGEIYNCNDQTWECFQAYNNDVYPNISPDNPSWYTFNRPLHGKSTETARPFVPVQGSHDMYRAGEYAVWIDGKIYKCKSDTAYSPADYAQAWEVVS